jgi:hypothetical protein
MYKKIEEASISICNDRCRFINIVILNKKLDSTWKVSLILSMARCHESIVGEVRRGRLIASEIKTVILNKRNQLEYIMSSVNNTSFAIDTRG